jgi:hypothetical protein
MLQIVRDCAILHAGAEKTPADRAGQVRQLLDICKKHTCDTGARQSKPSSSPVGSSSSWARKALKIASRPRLSDAAARETRSRSNRSLLFAVVRAGTKNNAARVNKAGEIHATPQRSGRGCVFC